MIVATNLDKWLVKPTEQRYPEPEEVSQEPDQCLRAINKTEIMQIILVDCSW